MFIGGKVVWRFPPRGGDKDAGVSEESEGRVQGNSWRQDEREAHDQGESTKTVEPPEGGCPRMETDGEKGA